MKTVKDLKEITQTKGEVYVENTGRVVRIIDLRSFAKMNVSNIMWVAYPLENGCHALMEVNEIV